MRPFSTALLFSMSAPPLPLQFGGELGEEEDLGAWWQEPGEGEEDAALLGAG